ncbi:hypothetical protein U5N28_10910 [Lysinibacillus telephonicus]|uniref:Sporulation protein n=1 Tax=Lysinibacillus telephonicus TaxID=1714840 RepID=A0A3S0QRR0_9BACI|nr:hypothetical protein [Lysinibacillus telephonicus]RTQ89865.1 hypothetical protein EKG35_15820 [Lysinibacillus telephonicus]
MKKMAFTLFLIPFFLIGCSNEQTIQILNESGDEEKRAEVEEMIKNTEEVYTGTAIFVEDELLVAIQVKPWLGFKERKVEKRLQKEIEEKYPDLNVVVSTDYKMHWETQKLLEEEDQKKVSEKVDKLKKLAKEET